MRAESYRPRGAIAMAKANTGKGRSRIENELLDCWSAEQKSGQRGAKRQRDAQQAQSSSTRNNDSEEETSRANEAADRQQYPEKFAKWDKEAKRGTCRKHATGKRKAGNEGRPSKREEELRAQVDRMEKMLEQALGMSVSSSTHCQAPPAALAKPTGKSRKDEKDRDGSLLAKKVSHCHRQHESQEQQRRREEKRVKTLVKATTMSQYLFSGIWAVLTLMSTVYEINVMQLDFNVRCQPELARTVRGGVGRGQRGQDGLHARTRQHQAGALQDPRGRGG